jgi:hypothetical protein
MKSPKGRPHSPKWRFFTLTLALVGVSVISAGLAGAATLADKNSLINLNLGSSSGMTDWFVDGGDQLNQQWVWFRVGSGPQFDISTLGAPTISTLGTKQLTALYQNSQYGVQISYTLSGGTAGTGTSRLSEQINFFNYTASPIDLHLYLYSDFTLGGPAFANLQNVSMTTTPDFGSVMQTVAGRPGLSNNVAVNEPPAITRFEVAPYPQTYNELTTTSNLLLNNNPAGGPGHFTWAMQWDSSVTNNGSLGTISITDTLQVPEPSTAALVLVAFGVGAWVRKKRVTDRT